MDRRAFLSLMGKATFASALPWSIERALAIPAHHRTGTIQDIEHIVILMQENRSFDHYFGTLNGVRGFGDPRAVKLPSGKLVWYQPNQKNEILPYRPTTDNVLGSEYLKDLDHEWHSMIGAWNNGYYDQWIPQKGVSTMVHMQRNDIPFHYALADAFTVCDAYHCSIMGPTNPNRYYMWSGMTGYNGAGNNPILDNELKNYNWTTYPELLEKAGVSWKMYQDIGLGLDAKGAWGDTNDPFIGNFGDNALLYFEQYQKALSGSPLAEKAKTGTNISLNGSLFDILRDDVNNQKLPQVSWIVAPEGYSEHPNWPSNYGAWYINQILETLTANEEVWSKTALFVVYDENDGFFDHVVPPVPPLSPEFGLSTVNASLDCFSGNAQFAAGPLGLGPRVPLLVISPWSKGGFVCSEVFDHTSLIRFIEKRFSPHYSGIKTANISPWRRAICGDLTSAFNFSKPHFSKPKVWDTSSYLPSDYSRRPDYLPPLPEQQVLPVQEKGLRPTRPLPYILNVEGAVEREDKKLHLHFVNKGTAGACFHLRFEHVLQNPKSYTVEAGKTLTDFLPIENNKYAISIHGPNGFFRSFKGDVTFPQAQIKVTEVYDHIAGNVLLCFLNTHSPGFSIRVKNIYNGEAFEFLLPQGKTVQKYFSLQSSFGWYDFVVNVDDESAHVYHLAGYVETGREGRSDPAFEKIILGRALNPN